MKNKIKVINNFLPVSYFEEIQKILEDADFGWYFQKNTVTGIPQKNYDSFYGFRHLFVNDGNVNSIFGPYIIPVVHHISDAINGKTDKIINIYSNMVLKKNHIIDENEWRNLSVHNDGFFELEKNGFERWTAILYIDDSDGDTVFFEKDKSGKLLELFRQEPQANTVVVFPSRILHSPGLPYKSFMRRVLNINILVKPNKEK